jgi:hypothetical protein
MNQSLVYCLDGHLHLVSMPYSDLALQEMAEDLRLVRDWLVTGKFKHYEIPPQHAAKIISKVWKVEHDLMFRAVEKSLERSIYVA